MKRKSLVRYNSHDIIKHFRYLSLLGVILILTSCCLFGNSGIETPTDTKYLDKFHVLTTNNSENINLNKGVALYVDFSNCIADGMKSVFYQKMVSPLTAATTEFWSIKGNEISLAEGDVYSLLNNIQEVNYAALDKAIAMMADKDCESVLLTDGELFTQTQTLNNPNNPYMHEAFKVWLLKGRDIHIIAEPYVERFKGQAFNKKRFYIIFTDDRVSGNVYDRIKSIVDFSQFPDVDEFHLSANYPWALPVNGNVSVPNDAIALNSPIVSGGDFEIQDWALDWDMISEVIINACDDEGTPKPNGDKLISGLRVNRNAFGCYRIKDIDAKAYNINAEYDSIYNSLNENAKLGKQDFKFHEITDFITYDKQEFQKHGNVDLYFDVDKFDPSNDEDLNGDPYNYIKIVLSIADIEEIIDNQIDLFIFDSVVQQGKQNESISESLKNCVFDPQLKNNLIGKVLYTIYLKTDKY
jgi:hypothetical protein